jgi:hypothetical protein
MVTVGAAGAGGGDAAASCDAAHLDPGPSPLKRLTSFQYKNAVTQLFGDVDISSAMPPAAANAYIGLAQADVAQFDVENYSKAAGLIAASAITHLDALAPCTNATDLTAAHACLNSFLAAYGPRIYRSPLNATDLTQLASVFDVGFTGAGYAHGIELTLEAMLSAPRFIYRPEFGDATAAGAGANAVPLSAYELASRLSFAFWNSAPDDDLLAAAQSGALLTPTGLDAQAQRLLGDPRANDSFRQFLYAWFGLNDLSYVSKDTMVYPEWVDGTAQAMRAQSDAFFDQVLFGTDGNLNTLFSAPLAGFAGADLAAWYQGATPETTSGILTLPALLTVHSKPRESFPIYRGVFVREQLLCSPLPAPPANVPKPPEPTPGVSARQRFAEHETNPGCSGCHQLIDPIGFAFENYDGVGHYRTTDDQGVAIDNSGALINTDSDGPFTGVAGLAQKLVASPQVQACAARQWFRYAMQRFDQAADACSITPLLADFQASGFRFASLRTSIINTPAFRMRRPITTDPGMTP